MVDKLIWGKIIEITIVISLVFISIPVWKNFEKRISSAKVTTLDDYKLNFLIEKNDGTDNIIVSNDYYINKNYKILLYVNNEIDKSKSTIKINNNEYNLNEFYSEKKDNHYIYTLVNEYISADINYYNIKPELSGANNNYYYKIEDNNIF